jgi:hypothetical protein
MRSLNGSKCLASALVLTLSALSLAACDSKHAAAPTSAEGGHDDGASGAAAGRDDGASGAAGAPSSCGMLPEPNAWAAWPMPNPASSMLPNPASYNVANSGNQVTDNVTGLVWQRTVDAKTFTWDEAQQYCSCLTIDGGVGWRLLP